MKKFINFVKKTAKANPKRIVFPEGFEERVLFATKKILKEKTAIPVLIGNPDIIRRNIKNLGIKLNFDALEIHDPLTSSKRKEFAEEFYNLRKNKGITEEEAMKTIEKINYFGTMMVHMGYADGMISGTTYSTAETVRPALQIIKTKEKFQKVSGVFFLILEKRLLLFADAAITIDPNSHDLADIAIDTAETAKKFNIEPRIGMLSFSTNGSAKHPNVDKVREATAIIKDLRPDLIVEGEMQVDAALVPDIAKRKFPESKLQGDANILIFPDLQSGNIAYKLVERLAKAKAIGPILQGLKKPINDLSRGCSWRDIANLAAFTSCEAADIDYTGFKKFK
ncbi:phosphate acetyltransferase [Patescibacteria group bacterium]|nr:phosphate acetyltransferase [Patescibacteria group bacterium]